ncbi:MAG: cobalt ECF transporter T component CbiQ [Armatimonadetes bacterium]|nr:cobalt ECF transporter T component CbiQ [Armatimonadota bacterium]
MLPSWIAESAPPRPARRRRSSSFLARTLRQTAHLTEQVVFAERAARRTGFLQSLDARVKLLSVLALLVTATFLHHLPSLWLLAALAVTAAALSRVEPHLLFNRVWWSLPGVFVIVALPAIFSFVTPGTALLTIYRFADAPHVGPLSLPSELAITRQGVASAALLVSRIAVGVLLAVCLTLTTRWQSLLKAAHTQATAPFVLITAMSYRYVFLLLHIVEDMYLARRARTISPHSLAAERRWIGGSVACLFSRSRRLTERVYAAMVARGYRGEPKVLAESRLGPREAAWIAACALTIPLVLLLDHVALRNLQW